MEPPLSGTSHPDSRFVSRTSGLPRPVKEESYPYQSSRSQANTVHVQYKPGFHDATAGNDSQKETSRQITFYPSASSQEGRARKSPSSYLNTQELIQSDRTLERGPAAQTLFSSPGQALDRSSRPHDRPGQEAAQSFSARAGASEKYHQGRPQRSRPEGQKNLYPDVPRPPLPHHNRRPIEGHQRSGTVEKSPNVLYPTLRDPMANAVHAPAPNEELFEPKPGYRPKIREMSTSAVDESPMISVPPVPATVSTGNINLGFVASELDPNSRYQNYPMLAANGHSPVPRYQNVPSLVTTSSKVSRDGNTFADRQKWGNPDSWAGQERKPHLGEFVGVVLDNSITKTPSEVSGKLQGQTLAPGAGVSRQKANKSRPKSSKSFDKPRARPSSQGEATPRFLVWLGLALFATLCVGWIPGVVALVYIWQARTEWEGGRTDKGHRSLRIGQICLLVSLLVGVACWAGIGYVIHMQSVQEGGTRRAGARPWQQYGDLIEEQRKSNLFWSQRQGPDPAG